jgi:hypothetical protein
MKRRPLFVFKIPDASAHAPLVVHHEKVPALFILRRLVSAISRQVLGSQRAILEIDPAAKPLELPDKMLALD